MKKSFSKTEFEHSKKTFLPNDTNSSKNSATKKNIPRSINRNFSCLQKTNSQNVSESKSQTIFHTGNQTPEKMNETNKQLNSESSAINEKQSLLSSNNKENFTSVNEEPGGPVSDKEKRGDSRDMVTNIKNKNINQGYNSFRKRDILPQKKSHPKFTSITDSTPQTVRKQQEELSIAKIPPPSFGNEIGFPKENTIPRVSLLSQTASIACQSNRSSNLRVCVRFRPINQVETELLSNNVGYICSKFSAYDNQIVTIKNEQSQQETPFTFDRVFSCESTQEEVHQTIGRETISDVLTGYNGTIFAYGQSGSGKTYTMYGDDIFMELNRGLIPRMISQIFDYVNTTDENVTFQFKLSVMQIYKEVIYDLLTGDKDLKIKENPNKGIYVDRITEVYVSSLEDFMNYVDIAQANRVVSGTKLNQYSSRSHSILLFEVTQTFQNENISKKGILNLVDLAGSEKISKTGAVGETLEEAKKINLSLSALGNVIHSLTSGAEHIPYRDSKLTRILQESLGGNYKTSLIVTCSPHSYHIEETLSSLKFAQRAKSIKNKVKLNIKLSYEELQKIINTLKAELEAANKEITHLKGLPPGKSVNQIYSERRNDELMQISATSLQLNEIFNEMSIANPKISGSECLEHRNKINILTMEVDNLKNEIREKDDIIARLEEEINRYKVKLKTGKDNVKSIHNEEPLRDSENHQSELKRLIEIYEDIANNIKTIKNEMISQGENPLGSFKKRSLFMVEKFEKIMESKIYQNGNVDNFSRSYLDLFDTVNELIRQNLECFSQRDEEDDDRYWSLSSDDLKIKIGEIFKDVFNGNLFMSDTNKRNNMPYHSHLMQISMTFLFGFVNFYFNMQVCSQRNNLLLNDNRTLKKMNNSLLAIVESILRSNQEVTQNYLSYINLNSQANAVQLLKASLIESGLTFNKDDNTANLNNLNIDAEAYKKSFAPESSDKLIRFVQPAKRISSGKIQTIISKKNLDLMKNIKELNTIVDPYARSFINLINCSYNDIPAGNDTPCLPSPVGKPSSFRELTSPKNNIENSSPHNIDTSQNKTPRGTINSNPSQYLPVFHKKTEKKLSKLSMLSNFIVQSIKENENFQQNLKTLKQDFENIIKMVEKEILKKVNDKEFFFSEHYETLNREKEEPEANFAFKPLSSFIYNETNRTNEIEFNRTFPEERTNSFYTIEKPSLEKEEHILKTEDTPSRRKRRRKFISISTDFHINRINNPQKCMEDLLADYLESGTVTRKFDGIEVKYENKILKCLYSGGLNAKNVTPSIPLKEHLKCSVGDESLNSIKSCEENECLQPDNIQ